MPVRAVISKTFTAFDTWSSMHEPFLCRACAWAYSTPQLRSSSHLIARDPAEFREVRRDEVHALLRAGALGVDVAVVVPLRPGRKHLLPDAQWGRVCVDDAQLPWTQQDAARLGTLTDLRRLGFGSRMLTMPVPPYQVLRRLPRAQWAPTIRAWRALEPWRGPGNPWLPIAIHITSPVQEAGS